MDNLKYTTEIRKNQHLCLDEREEIQIRLKDGWSIYRIAKSLNRSYNTIKTEIKRGTVEMYGGHVKRYKATAGQQTYESNRQTCRKQYKRLIVSAFIHWVEEEFREKHWSLDACVGRATLMNIFTRDKIVCTKTLYNYVDNGLLQIKNIDLPEKLRRNTKTKRVRENKKHLGKSIEERPDSVETREEFGHWEFDSVLGSKNAGEAVILTLVERMTRNAIWLKIEDHSSRAVTKAVLKLKNEFGNYFPSVFKTITADNGSEFADLSGSVTDGTEVYFTHPFSSWEKGTNEFHNRILRRFIPKGKSISGYNEEDIAFMADWSNSLPRKILGYRTPEELFEEQLDRIYAA